MAAVSSPSYSSPSSSAAHNPFARPVPTAMGCESCGAPRAGFFRSVLERGQAVATIERVCPLCAGEDDSPADTIGATGLRASDDVSQAATTRPSTSAPAPAARINFLSPRGARPLEPPWFDAFPARNSLPDPFRTLLHGVSSSWRDWVRGVLRSLAG
jgi:hypothetical protein